MESRRFEKVKVKKAEAMPEGCLGLCQKSLMKLCVEIVNNYS